MILKIHKSGGPLTVFRLLYTYKKAGLHCCCSASLALVLPSYPNKQHRSPRRYVRTRTPMLYLGVRI